VYTDNTAYYPPIGAPITPTPPQGLPGQTPLPMPGAPPNALAQAMRAKNTKPPFAGVLAKAGAPASGRPVGAASPAGAPAPQITPQQAAPTDPLAGPEAADQAAGQAITDYKPYQEQAVPYQAPTKKADDPLRSAIDLIAAGLLARRGGRTSLNIGNMENAREQQYQTDYDTATKEADARWQRQTADEQKKAANSEREYNALLGRKTATEKNLEAAQALQQKQHFQTLAAKNTERLTNGRLSYWTSEAAANQQRLRETALRDANQYNLKNKGYAVELEKDALDRAGRLSLAGVNHANAIDLANRNFNLRMAVARMQELGKDQRWAGDQSWKQQNFALKQLSTNYDNVLKAAAQPGAPDSATAAAEALLAPSAPGKPSAYDQLMSNLRTLQVGGQGTGIVPITSGALEGVRDQANAFSDQTQAAYSDAIESGQFPDQYFGGAPGATGQAGGTTLNVYTGNHGTPNDEQPGGSAGYGYVGSPGSMSTAAAVGFGHAPPALQQPIEMAASQYGVDPGIMSRMLATESGFSNVDAKGNLITSRLGAQGIAQFMPDTAKQYHVNVNDPISGIYGMANYMGDLQKRYAKFGPLAPYYAVAAYNAGPDRVDAAHGDVTKLPPETQAYLKSVFGGGDTQQGPSYGDPRFRNQTPGQLPPSGNKASTASTGATHTTPVTANPPATSQDLAPIAEQMYKTKFMPQDVDIDKAWPQIKQILIDTGKKHNTPVTEQALQNTYAQISKSLKTAYAAEVKNTKDAQNQGMVDAAQAGQQAVMQGDATGYGVQAPKPAVDASDYQTRAQRLTAANNQPPPPQAPAQQVVSGFVKAAMSSGGMTPQAYKQITSVLIGQYHMPPRQALMLVRQAVAAAPQPQRPVAQKPQPPQPPPNYGSRMGFMQGPAPTPGTQ
jgi:hypothetical protein